MINFNDEFPWKYVIAAVISILGVAIIYLLICYCIKQYKNKRRINKIESKIRQYQYMPLKYDIPEIVINNSPPPQYYQSIQNNHTNPQQQYYNLNNGHYNPSRLSGCYNY